MNAPNVTRWIGIGLLGLALYGLMTFFSSLDPQPDPTTQPEAWLASSLLAAMRSNTSSSVSSASSLRSSARLP